MIDGKPKKPAKVQAAPDGEHPPDAATYRENEGINARIDRYVAEHPRDADYYKNMPSERLFRSVILLLAEREDNKQRMQQNLIKRLDRHPEIKEATMKAVESLPEDQKQKIMANVARSLPPAQTQTPTRSVST